MITPKVVEGCSCTVLLTLYCCIIYLLISLPWKLQYICPCSLAFGEALNEILDPLLFT